MIMLLLFRIISLQNNLLYIICHDLPVSVELIKNWKHCRVPLQTCFFLKNSNETYLKYIYIYIFLILFLNFTILYWFCQISKWIRHRYTCVPHPEPSSLLPPCSIPLGRRSAPAPSIQYRLVSYSMPFSQIIPPTPSPTESKRLKSQCHYIIFPFKKWSIVCIEYYSIFRLQYHHTTL